MKHLPALVALCAAAGLSSVVSVAHAQCDSFPIAVSAATIAGIAPGTIVANVFNGSQPGGAGWLTWNGDNSEGALAASLTGAGNSYTYVNPLNPADNDLQAGDYVQSKPGVSNGKAVRDALDNLVETQITVPVWDVAEGSGANAYYHITAFAVIQIISYDIPHNRITAMFLGYNSCNPVRPPS